MNDTCPNCGGTNTYVVDTRTDEDVWFVICSDCDAELETNDKWAPLLPVLGFILIVLMGLVDLV